MHQALEGTISKSGWKELDEALRHPGVREYYEKLRLADKIVEKGLAGAKKYGMDELEGLPPDEEIEEDIRKYGGMKDDNLRRLVDEAARKFEARRSGRRIIFRSAAAAALVLGLVLGWVVLKQGPERLYAKYYSPLEYNITRSEINLAEGYFNAIEYYNEGRYAESAELIGIILENEPGNREYRFLYALSLQGNREIDRAMEQYRLLLDSGEKDEKYTPLSAWYLGLCYLLKGDKDSADHYLEIAAEEGGMWIDREKVEEIRGRL